MPKKINKKKEMNEWKKRKKSFKEFPLEIKKHLYTTLNYELVYNCLFLS